MKHIIIALALLLSSAWHSSAQKNNTLVTETITVKGTCSQCKNRIEDAAYISGVKRAEWNKTTKELTVTYRKDKTSLNKIEESIAKKGHDAGDVKAADQDYNKLPECCAYKHDHATDH
jgi:mercuric ion binding protein